MRKPWLSRFLFFTNPAGSDMIHVVRGRGGIGRLDGFRFHYLSGVRVRVPPPAPKFDRFRQEACRLFFVCIDCGLLSLALLREA